MEVRSLTPRLYCLLRTNTTLKDAEAQLDICRAAKPKTVDRSPSFKALESLVCTPSPDTLKERRNILVRIRLFGKDSCLKSVERQLVTIQKAIQLATLYRARKDCHLQLVIEDSLLTRSLSCTVDRQDPG